MNRILIILGVLLVSLSTPGQKAYWKSSYSKINAPVGGTKNIKDIVKKEFVYPMKALTDNVEGAVDISYRLNKDGTPKVLSVSGIDNDLLIAEAKRIFGKIRFPYSKLRTGSESPDLFQLAFSKKDWMKLYNKRKYREIEYPHLPIDSTQRLYHYQLLEKKPEPIFSKKEPYSDFYDYIVNKLEYPPEALKLGLKGDVVVSFVIEQSGHVTNIEIIKTMPAGCTEEALRLIKNVKWFPALENGIAVRTLMKSSIGFGVKSSPYQESFNQGN
ncbi:MAG: hypothetical protein CL840_14455 [Crocinitomicaceae bacterium]|nr:hypothetical protein [Crocinitomicaceae bacterium]|tara:strand:- start:7480 stop:8292 length:813 start_codon:yes stop_codon:yes gene_type:complete